MKNLAVRAAAASSRGISDMVDVYSPENWTVIKGKQLATRKQNVAKIPSTITNASSPWLLLEILTHSI